VRSPHLVGSRHPSERTCPRVINGIAGGGL
jgi:hypothetical protein